MPRVARPFLLAALAALSFGQSRDAPPSFEFADVHTSPASTTPFFRGGPVRNGRYQLRNATMLDLIRIAWGVDSDKILGGPSWLDMDRFDVTAKVTSDANSDSQKLMLQALLRERFKLTLHNDTRPLPVYALKVGKKLQIKEADGSGDTSCRVHQPDNPPEGGGRMIRVGPDGKEETFVFGPGRTIQFQCRNMTMAAFAEGLRGMMGAGAELGTAKVADETGLKGAWNFDVRWSMGMIGPMAANGDRITLFEALEKQLGLKLEQKQAETPVIVVDSVNRAPIPNPPGTAEALPEIQIPKEFEVAEVKPTDPNAGRLPLMGMMLRIQPGGRVTAQGIMMNFLLMSAFNTFNNEAIVGIPNWAESARFDITAKAAASTQLGPADREAIAPMLLSLLQERFGLKFHKEERSLNAYSLVAPKPRMKRADPASRASCKRTNAPAGSPPGTQVMTCQNITMTQFAEQLRGMTPELAWPVEDATGLEGGWDFTLNYRFNFPMMAAGPGRGGDSPPSDAAVPSAADPVGGYTLFEAVEKELGLKLEMRKRPMPVVVIDRLNQTPSEN